MKISCSQKKLVDKLEITEIEIFPFNTKDVGGNTLAIADITLDNAIKIKSIKLLETKSGGLFLAYPNQRGKNGDCGKQYKSQPEVAVNVKHVPGNDGPGYPPEQTRPEEHTVDGAEIFSAEILSDDRRSEGDTAPVTGSSSNRY